MIGVELKGVTKSYKLKNGEVKPIITDLTATVPWKNIGLVGRNGAGKSTFLRLLAGIIEPDEGDIRRNASISFPLGFRGSFHRDLSGIENVRFVSRIYGQNTEYIVDYVREFSELGQFLNEPYKTYSSGMGARLAFGLSLAMDFDIYLIDEIMSVGDKNFQEKSSAAFHDRMKTACLYMVSHSMEVLEEYCEAGIMLENGVLTYYDDIADAVAAYNGLF